MIKGGGPCTSGANNADLSKVSERNRVHRTYETKPCACSAWDPHNQKDKAALERVQ